MEDKTRILIVDDSADVRADLRTLLDLIENVEVIGEANNCDEAIAQSKAMQPDITVMDLEMKNQNLEVKPIYGNELDGCLAIYAMKESQPGMTILVLTVHDYKEAEQKSFEAGADAFLVKGRDTEKLLKIIRNYERK